MTNEAKKRQWKANRRDAKQRRAERRKEIRCFWTWPFGHHRHGLTCVGCGHRASMM